MRRKSHRNASKATERPPEPQKKTRRQSKRQKKSSSRSTSEDSEERQVDQQSTENVEQVLTTNEETEQPVWKVTPSSTPSGEIQKLKFCLTRPLMSPEKERSSRRRQNKSGGQTDEDITSPNEKVSRKSRQRGSSGDNFEEYEDEHDQQEDKKGKGKSKTKHKSKSEKSAQMQGIEDNSQSEISENVQVTPQSPQAPIDTKVDNESLSTVESETVTEETENPETLHHNENTYNDCESEIRNMEVEEPDKCFQANQSNTPPPILEKHVDNPEIDISDTEECSKGCEAPQLTRADSKEQPVDESMHVEITESKTDLEQTHIEEVNGEATNEEEVNKVSVEQELNETDVKEKECEMETSDSVNLENEDLQTTTNTTNVTEAKVVEVLDLREELSCQTPLDRQESDNSSEVVEHDQSNASPINEAEVSIEILSKSMEVDDNQSENDSMSRDTTMDATSTFKENMSFDITSSFSPDIKQMEEVNQEVQEMKDKAVTLLQTPTQTTRKWGNSLVGLEMMRYSLQKIDINTIKEFCPTLQFLDESEVKIDVREKKSSYSHEKRKISVDYKSDDGEYKKLATQTSVNSTEMEETVEPEVDNSNIIAMNRKISIVDDTASKLKPPPSPAKNPISKILYITNLVRPFTLKQLKELLERTGKIIDDGFWTDRIKSKCYAHYESIEESEATRNALHGVNWPIGNGKKLIIEYATEEDFEKAKNPTPPPVVVPVPQLILEEKTIEKDVINEIPKTNKIEEGNKIIRQRHRTEGHIREWDVGKENLQKSRYRSKELDDKNDRHKRRRTPSPTNDFITRKEKKKEEDVPQKLMDDLFRKTKITPSIYWLPLTPEEIATKQQQRLLRMAEHKRRMEESSRNRGEYGRGAPYRRRYD